ncbi:hypothetical protein FRC07_006425 [Ceratobasidium sp. 392]|nr:hypothetical protein FRC07_006425 [Ceratobasidium sp. 392]
MSDNSSIKHGYYHKYSTLNEAPSRMSLTLYATSLPAYFKVMRNKNGVALPDWTAVCDVSANIQDAKSVIVRKYNSGAGPYYVLQFKIAVHFGGTQLAAHIE